MGLFKPAWKSKNIEKAIKAVEKLDDQRILTNIAIYESHPKLRFAAMNKLTDPKLLYEVAVDGRIVYTYEADCIASKLPQQALVDIIRSGAGLPAMRCGAIKYFTDQEMLIDIAKNNKDEEIRLAAADKLLDKALAQTVYCDVATNTTSSETRSNAIGRIENKDEIVKIKREVERKCRHNWKHISGNEVPDSLEQEIAKAKETEYGYHYYQPVLCTKCGKYDYISTLD